MPPYIFFTLLYLPFTTLLTRSVVKMCLVGTCLQLKSGFMIIISWICAEQYYPGTCTSGKVICMSVVVHTKIASLGDLGTWATCKANKYVRISKNWPQHALNRSAPAISITNTAFLAMHVDRTYFLGHVLFTHVHNCRMTGSGRQQTLCLYCRWMNALPLHSLRY